MSGNSYCISKADRQHLAELVNLMSGPHNFISNLSKCKKFADLKTWIIDKTGSLLSDSGYTLGTRIFYIVNGLTALPQCANPECRSIVKTNFTAYADKTEHSRCHCCVRCIQLDPAVKVKIEKTTLRRHGCRRGRHTDDVHEKMKHTFQAKYGVDYPLQSKQIYEQTRATLSAHYGALCTFDSPEIQDRIHQTLSSHYGVDFPFCSSSIRGKARQTLAERYGASCAHLALLN